MSVVALVPTKDGADSIAATVTALRTVADIDEIVVVDDGSTDDTADRARAVGASVLRLTHNVGKGGAIAAGLAAFPTAEIYVLVDADLRESATAVRALVGAVIGGDADLAIGKLPPAAGRGGFGLVKRRSRQAIERACGFSPAEPLSGQRAIRGELLRSFHLAERFGVEVGMTIDAVRAGARVVEIPVPIEHRHTGRRLDGFRHRARQGRDILRAVWPRLTTARQRIALMVSAGALAIILMGVAGAQWPPDTVPLPGRAAKVVVFGFPHLSFDDLSGRAPLPNLTELSRRGAVGALSVRTASDDPSTHEAYTSLGAGVRLRSIPLTGQAFDTGDGKPGASRSAPTDGAVLVAGADRAIRAVAGDHLSSGPGALGDALHRAGLKTAAVGNADRPGASSGASTISRPAAAAVMDSDGIVDAGVVGDGLLEPAREFGFGVRASRLRLVAETTASLSEAAVVVVDPGDMERAAHAGSGVSPQRAAELRDLALRHTDDILGDLIAAAPADSLVIVVSPVPPGATWRLTPLIVAGSAVPSGYAQSTSTMRLGLAAITDVAPTALAALGLPPDAGMVGRPLRYAGGGFDLGYLKRLDQDRAEAYRPVAGVFVAGEIALYLLVIVAVRRRRRGAGRRGWLRFSVLAATAFPVATFFLRALPTTAGAGAATLPVLAAICCVIAAAVGRASRHPLAPLGWIMALTSLVILGDVATGSRLHASGLLGYPLASAAGRFYGVTNTTFAALAACVLLGMAMHVAYSPRRREALVAAGLVATVAVVGDGAPSIGNDVGGIITLVPMAGIGLWCFSGRRLSWRVLVGVAALLVVALALAAGVDLLRPPEARSHLGRFASSLRDDPGLLVTTSLRKIEANFGVLSTLPWTWVIPVACACVLYLLVRRRIWSDLLPPGSPLRTGVVIAVVASLVGFLVNDSGPVVIAMFFVFIVPFVSLLALEQDAEPTMLPPTAP